MRRAAIGLLLLLAACGDKQVLTPLPGTPAPPVPAGARTPPTTDDMLKVSPQAAPNRVNDPVRRSEDRPPDPFDLPPPG